MEPTATSQRIESSSNVSLSQSNTIDILSLQKELRDKDNELTIAYQTSLELIETNNELQQQLEESTATIQALEYKMVDHEMKIDLLDAQNQEYLQTISQTNEKYEESLGEVAVLREQLLSTRDDIKEYQQTIQSLNHNLLQHPNPHHALSTNTNSNASRSATNDESLPPHDSYLVDGNGSISINNNNHHHHHSGRSTEDDHSATPPTSWKERYERQQVKYEEVLRECERYRLSYDQILDQLELLETMKRDAVQSEKRNKLLSDQIVELSYSNVQLERELNDYSMENQEQRETIQFLQNEHQNLMQQTTSNVVNEREVNMEPAKLSGSKRRLYSFYGAGDGALDQLLANKESLNGNGSGNNTDTESVNMDLKRRLSVQLRDNFSFNSKLVMYAHNIEGGNTTGSSNGSQWGNVTDDGRVENRDNEEEEERTLFTMVQNYENHEEFLKEENHQELHQQKEQEQEQEQDQEESQSLSDLDTAGPHQPETPQTPQTPKAAKKKENMEYEQKEESPTKSKSSSNASSPSKLSKSKSVPPALANKSRKETLLGLSAANSKLKTPSKSPSKTPISTKIRPERKPQRTRPRKTTSRHVNNRETDALDEYLHLTASAVKINHPTVDVSSKKLIEMIRGLPFYQAHDYLNRYMMDRLRWEQIQQNKLLQLKAAAIQSQRDHEMAKQSTVTRFFKRLFTNDDDDGNNAVHHHVVSAGNGGGGRHGVINLGAPLSKGENFKLKGVGKAKVQSTKSGGQRVHLSSLDLEALSQSTGASTTPHSNNHSNSNNATRKRIGDDALRRKRERQEQRLKTLSLTQTLPNSRLNDKNVQKMLQINADYIDSVIRKEQKQTIKDEKSRESPVKRALSPYSMNQHRARRGSNRYVTDSGNIRRSQAMQSQTVGWFEWLSGTQQTAKSGNNPSHAEALKTPRSIPEEHEEDDDSVQDPYALANSGKRRERRRNGDQRKSRKSKSPNHNHNQKEVQSGNGTKRGEEDDINANIKEVLNQQHDKSKQVKVDDVNDDHTKMAMAEVHTDPDEEMDMSVVEDLNDIIDEIGVDRVTSQETV